MNFLLETATTTSAAMKWVLPVILLLLIIGIFVLNYFRSKKNQEQMKDMVSSLKVGDNVKTYSGLYGRIIEIIETTDGKVAVLETGSDKNKGIFSIDINAIFAIDEKQAVVYDKDGNIISPNPSPEASTASVTEVKEKVKADKKESAKSTEIKGEKVKKKEAKEEKEETKEIKKEEKKEERKETKKPIKKATKKDSEVK